MAFAGAASAATLDGDEVGCSISDTFWLWGCSSSTYTVGAGSEFGLTFFGINNVFSIDVGGNSVSLTLNSFGLRSGPDETVTLSGLNFSPVSEIVGIENFASDVTSGISESDISFTSDSASIFFGSSNWSNLESLSFDLVTREIGAIPLPAGFPLLLAGLGAFGLVRRSAKA